MHARFSLRTLCEVEKGEAWGGCHAERAASRRLRSVHTREVEKGKRGVVGHAVAGMTERTAS
jgi:hypothetical protein